MPLCVEAVPVACLFYRPLWTTCGLRKTSQGWQTRVQRMERDTLCRQGLLPQHVDPTSHLPVSAMIRPHQGHALWVYYVQP